MPISGKINIQFVPIHLIVRYLAVIALFVGTIFMQGCSTSRNLDTGSDRTLIKIWDSLDMASSHHVGLSIYDVEKRKYVFNYRDDNFFTPGSNVKLLTMYAALHYLPEFVPAAYYQYRKDTVIVWGGGDPGTLYPTLNTPSSLINFLQSTDKTIIFSNHHFQSQRFGEGWAWDDYPYSFQSENTAFPIYGNNLWIERFKESIVTSPKYFDLILSSKRDTIEKLTRNESGTQYNYRYDLRNPYALNSIPVSLYENDIRFIWQEATGKEILFHHYPFVSNTLRLDGSNRDTMIRIMMQESDNFIAEQLLHASALSQNGSMNQEEIIRQAIKGPLAKSPDSLVWVDGSGLSRYNQLTPRSVIWLLERMIKEKGIEYLKIILPAGGHSGTLKNTFRSSNRQPYIFAKSGSMRHTYCLSGILVTRSGKVLLFSWMNNQFLEDTSDIKMSMERLFTYLRDQY